MPSLLGGGLSLLTGGGSSTPISIPPTPTDDYTPSAFDLGGPYTDGEPDAVFYSTPFTLAGVTADLPIPISMSGGHGGCCGYQVFRYGEWSLHTQDPGDVYLGEQIRLRTRFSAVYSDAFIITLTIGGVSDTASFATIAEDFGEPDDPVDTQTSADGANPLTWSTNYGDNNLVIGIDYVLRRWRVNGGAWTTEDPIAVTSDWYFDHIVDGLPQPWGLYDIADFDAGGLIETQPGISREGVDYWGPVLSDVIAAADAHVDVVYLGGRTLPFGYGADPISTTALANEAGDKIYICVTIKNNGSTTAGVTAKDGSNVNIPLTPIGSLVSDATDRMYLYFADLVAAGTFTVTSDPDASVANGAVEVAVIRGAAAGGPTDFQEQRRAITDTIGNINLGVSLPTNGRVIVNVDAGDAPHTYTGATKIADLVPEHRLTMAVQDEDQAEIEDGDILLNGQNDTPAGPAYQSINIAVTSWSPA